LEARRSSKEKSPDFKQSFERSVFLNEQSFRRNWLGSGQSFKPSPPNEKPSLPRSNP